MSHFTVLIVGEDAEKQLAPFQENNMGDCPKEYLEFNDVEEENRKDYEEGIRHEFYCGSSSSWGQPISSKNYAVIKDLAIGEKVQLKVEKEALFGYFKKDTNYRCYDAGSEAYKGKDRRCPSEDELIWIKVVGIVKSTHPDPDVCFEGEIEVEVVNPPKEIALKEYYPEGFDSFIKEWSGYEKDPENGKYGYWENPNAKWDWFQVGGRWSGFFIMKKGCNGDLGKKSWCNASDVIADNKADQARKGDIDWDKMVSSSFEEYSKKYDKFEELLGLDPEKAKQSAYWDFNVENVSGKALDEEWIPESREQYLKKAITTTFAVIKDGKWYEKGSMGWWGAVSDKKDIGEWAKEFEKLIVDLPDETLLTVVDCHI